MKKHEIELTIIDDLTNPKPSLEKKAALMGWYELHGFVCHGSKVFRGRIKIDSDERAPNPLHR